MNLTAKFKVTLWEIFEEGDEKPTYSLKWIYKNTYFEFFGKMNKEEMSKLAKEIFIKLRRISDGNYKKFIGNILILGYFVC